MLVREHMSNEDTSLSDTKEHQLEPVLVYSYMEHVLVYSCMGQILVYLYMELQ